VTTAGDIDALLPQTQCTRCGYPACRPYAEAIARGEADINQCPPGGQPVIEALAALLARRPKPLNPANGVQSAPRVAVIDEARCIGCARCLPACPVDAIVGTRRYMHTVIGAECSGCELCLPPCPVDCIVMVPASPASAATLLSLEQTRHRAGAYRHRYQAHLARRTREEEERARLLAARKHAARTWSGHESGGAH
jgi:electron transport complex protein RnfB